MSNLSVNSGLASFLATSANSAAPAKNTKLHDAAQSFEALMLGEMLKSVRESSESGWMGSGGDDASSGSAVEMAETHFANALAKGGGLGLAKMVEQSVGKQSHDTSAPVPSS